MIMNYKENLLSYNGKEVIIGKYPFDIRAFKNGEQKLVVYAVPVYTNAKDFFAVLDQLKGNWVIDLI